MTQSPVPVPVPVLQTIETEVALILFGRLYLWRVRLLSWGCFCLRWRRHKQLVRGPDMFAPPNRIREWFLCFDQFQFFLGFENRQLNRKHHVCSIRRATEKTMFTTIFLTGNLVFGWNSKLSMPGVDFFSIKLVHGR